MTNIFEDSLQVVINGKVVNSIITSTGGVIYQRLPTPSISISVPLDLTYSDAFNISGALTTPNNEGIVGETVYLKVGSTVVDSTTTTTDGAYSFTQTPVTMGNHSFQVIYEGSEEYNASASSVIERVIGKETSVLTVTNPLENSAIYSDSSCSITGTLLSDDGEAMANKSIVVSENGTILTTLTTGNNGSFTGSISGLSVGVHSLTFTFVSDENYTASTVTRTLNVNNHSYSLSANVDMSALLVGDSVTINGVLLKDGNGYANQTVTIYDGTTNKGTCTTDSNGAYSKTVTSLAVGSHSLKAVTSVAESEVKTVNVYEDVVVATVTGNSIKFGFLNTQWLYSTGDVIIDWGDGSTDTVNNPKPDLTHSYSDGLSSHDIKFIGNVTSLGSWCFQNCTGLTSIIIPNSITSLAGSSFYGCTGLTSVTIPNSVTNIGSSCFGGCTGLTSIIIPNSVTNIGFGCFEGCTALIDYQLYWTGNNIITYNSETMPNNTNTIYTIPQGQTANYVAKGYPSAKLVERGESLTLTSDKPIIQNNETSTITATLKDTGTPLTSKTLNYQIKHGSTVLSSGTKTTDNQGQATITYTGTGVGDVDVIVSYGSLLQETYEVEDCYFYDTLTTDKNLFSIRRGTGTLTYSNTGLTFRDSTSSETNVLFSEQLPTTDYEVSYHIVSYGNTNNKPQVCFEDFFLGINNGGYYGRRISQSGNIWNETGSPTPPHTIKHQITGTSSKTVKTYQNDNLLGTATGISQTREMQIFAYEDGRSITFTNLKIKAL